MVVINILDHRKAHKLRQSQDFRCRDSIETRLELAIHLLGLRSESVVVSKDWVGQDSTYKYFEVINASDDWKMPK